jgi:hypothetical protein
MRIVDCTVWKHKIAIAAILLYFIVSGIHPAAVKWPLSSSLVGRSSQMKLSVRSIARSILFCRILRQRNQTVISGSLNVGSIQRTSRSIGNCAVIFWGIKLFANRIVKGITLCSSGVETIALFFLKVRILSTFKKHCQWYQNLTFEQYRCSVPERLSDSRKGNYFQTFIFYLYTFISMYIPIWLISAEFCIRHIS